MRQGSRIGYLSLDRKWNFRVRLLDSKSLHQFSAPCPWTFVPEHLSQPNLPRTFVLWPSRHCHVGASRPSSCSSRSEGIPSSFRVTALAPPSFLSFVSSFFSPL